MSSLNPEELRVVQLKTELKKRGLSQEGRKAELVSRLEDAIAGDSACPVIQQLIPGPKNFKAQDGSPIVFCPGSFVTGFSNLRDPKYSDVTVNVGNGTIKESFPCSRAVLAAHSPVLRAMLYNGMKESFQTEIEIGEKIDPQVFELVLHFFYTGFYKFNPSTVLGVIRVCDFLQVTSLFDEAKRMLSGCITPTSVLELLPRAKEEGMAFIFEMCLKFVDEFAPRVFNHPDFKKLPSSIMVEVLRRDSLQADELDIFKAVRQWEQHRAGHNKQTGRDAASVRAVVEQVRIPLIDPEHLADIVEPSGLVDPNHLLEAYRFHHSKKRKRQFADTRFRKRACTIVNLTNRESDFDENGIFFWIGTNGRTEPYKNPFRNKDIMHVDIMVDPIAADCNDDMTPEQCMGCMLDRSNTWERGYDFWTENKKDASYTFDFGAMRSLAPTSYTMRRGGGDAAILNWVLEGSNDQMVWETLSSHENDKTFEREASADNDYSSHTFDVNGHDKVYYRYLRIRINDVTDKNNYYLSCCGAEFYGHLKVHR